MVEVGAVVDSGTKHDAADSKSTMLATTKLLDVLVPSRILHALLPPQLAQRVLPPSPHLHRNQHLLQKSISWVDSTMNLLLLRLQELTRLCLHWRL